MSIGEPKDDRLQESVAATIQEDLHTSVNLVRHAQAGDSQALSDLLARYESRLHRIVRVRLGSKLKQHVESVDIVQETFTVAFQKIDAFELRSHASILQWLARIAENKIRETNKFLFADKRNRDRNLAMDAPKDDASVSGLRLAAEQTAVPERAMKQEVRELMDAAMTRLQEDHREVILLRDYSSASWDFVEEVLGRSKAACQELHRRAWIRLRSEVKAMLNEG